MVDADLAATLEHVVQRLGGLNVAWCVVGSAAAVLHGVDLVVGDLDLLTDADGAYRIERTLGGRRLAPVAWSSTGAVRSHFGCAEVRGMRVEIMGELEVLDGGRWRLAINPATDSTHVAVGQSTVPVATIAALSALYAGLGRRDRLNALQRRGGL